MSTALTWPVIRAIGRVVGWAWEGIGWGERVRMTATDPAFTLIEARGPLARWIGRDRGGRRWTGVTIGDLVLAWRPRTESFIRHEQQHVRQGLRFGLMFWVLYMWELLRRGYRANRFEVEAKAAEGSRMTEPRR